MRTKMKQLGQGMTEYIIIVALIAIAAIAAYGFFGDTLRSQMGTLSAELAGDTAQSDAAKAQAAAKAGDAISDGATSKKLTNFTDANK
jgi:Flp pilus assembly pilin Flp